MAEIINFPSPKQSDKLIPNKGEVVEMGVSSMNESLLKIGDTVIIGIQPKNHIFEIKKDKSKMPLINDEIESAQIHSLSSLMSVVNLEYEVIGFDYQKINGEIKTMVKILPSALNKKDYFFYVEVPASFLMKFKK